jgi:hypothetical protein
VLCGGIVFLGCGGLSRNDGLVPHPDDDTSEELFTELCRRTQASGCSPMNSMELCVQVFTSELDDARDAGCEEQALARTRCWAKQGFHCGRGVFLWNDGCSQQELELETCQGQF